MQIQLAGSDFKRSYGVQYQKLENLLVEPIPGGKVMRFSRGGLSESYTVGTGPVRGLFQASGLFNGDKFSVSGTSLYRGADLVSAVSGTDDIRWAASSSQLVPVANNQAYLYNGTMLSTIAMPDFQPVSDTVYLAGRFVYSVFGAGRFYWSEVNDAANIDPLSFATAETGPDAIIGMATLVDDLYLFGAQTVEIWAVTGDSDLPFSRPPGRKYNRGCISKGSITYADNALFWVGENLIVYRSGADPQRVSDFSVEERISRSSNPSGITAWSITREGHELLVMNIPGSGSVCYDLSNQKWSEWSSYQRANFRGRCAIMVSGIPYIGDDQLGTIGTLSTDVDQDYGDPITQLTSFWIDQPGGIATLNNIVLQGARGQGRLNEQIPDVGMRLSKDQGQTFTPWDYRETGGTGQYSHRAVWLRQGQIVEPGILGEFRSTAPVISAMTQALVNVPRPYG